MILNRPLRTTCDHFESAGLTYCAVATLKFITGIEQGQLSPSPESLLESSELESLIYWLLQRQTTYIEDQDDYSSEEEPLSQDGIGAEKKDTSGVGAGSGGMVDRLHHTAPFPPTSFVGLNGRVNKIADTCYCWWNIGTLAVWCCPKTRLY